MSGKSYTMKEMKTIVDYLTENKLYGEIRGRKMWMDFANSQLTTRSWQSLKETFLKRILNDIHNPYYKLTIEQINSFRAGFDIGEREKNKLEIHPMEENSSSNGQNQNYTTQSNNGISVKEENISGENIKCSKIPPRSRSSADTVIVDTCYETAADIQKDLESPTGDDDNREKRSLRDCITYSEPLTPMLQEVLDDFQSEPENEPEVSDRENQLEIVVPETENSENINQEVAENVTYSNGNEESAPVADDAPKDITEPSTCALEENVNGKSDNQVNEKAEIKNQESESNVEQEQEVVCLDDSPSEENEEIITEKKNKNTPKVNTAEKDTTNVNEETTKNQTDKNVTSSVANDTENTDVVVVHDSNSECVPASSTLNNSNTTTDASLPNNPEALNNSDSNEKQDEVPVLTKNNPGIKAKSRKRSNSGNAVEGTSNENKKTKLENKMSNTASDIDNKNVIETVANNETNSVDLKNTVMEVDTFLKNNNETKVNKVVPNLPSILEKPSTSVINVDSSLDGDQSNNVNVSSEIKNPCLQNVSLYDEQLNKKKYNTSESSDIELQKTKTDEKKEEKTFGKKMEKEKKEDKVYEKKNDIVMLKSHTESDTEEIPTPAKKKHRAGVVSSKTDRNRALANVFGFSSGATNSKRTRHFSRRRRTISQNIASHGKVGSDSSEWTSESDSDMYVSPPRGRRNRSTRKYLKPQSGRILSLEEEGGLFVMYGKKIYPVVKDGKLVKNYLTYLPESESEEEESYWKLKYVEEKKKADELKKLLEKAKEPHASSSTSATQADVLRSPTCNHNPPQESPSNPGKEICLPSQDEKKETQTKAATSESIKIKFTTKNDQEIHLEGNWPQIHNVLEHVVHIFHKEPQPISDSRPKTIVEPASSSGISTPVVITAVQDPEVHDKVNQIESEIFKEIEERDQEEKSPSIGQETNVTKRRPGRQRKSSQSSISQSPAKRQKKSNEQDSMETRENNTKIKTPTSTENNISNEASKKQGRTPRQILNETPNNNETATIQTRRSKLNSSITGQKNDDEEVRYMLPPRNKRQSIKSTTDKKTRDKSQKSTTKPPKIFSSPETVCPNSLESTQGYQDSDVSPMKIELRKKKRMNISTLNSRTKNATIFLRRSSRKKSHPHFYCDQSSSSSVDVPVKKVEQTNSTLNTEVYKSESYQLLMAGGKRSFSQLEPIDETNPIGNGVDFVKRLDATTNNEVCSSQMTTDCNRHCSSQVISDIGSSSSVSLPLSPELSVVESLSFSKDMLNAFDDGPTINEMQCNNTKVPTTCSQYLISDIDVSVPLMQQECELEGCNILKDLDDAKNPVTESLLGKISTFKIGDQTNVTDSLDSRLRDLLLESAKKMSTQNIQNEMHNMEVDESNVDIQKKANSKQRCSTPRKRKQSQKSKKGPKVQTLIEEEHIETYSQGGRKSCPPIVQSLILEDNVGNNVITIANLSTDDKVRSKSRRKKDIIKVKILRPKTKKSQNYTAMTAQHSSKNSFNTDSGINDPESGIFLPDISVDLIHNHSETCLHANECVGDSVEFVENSVRSVLTLEDSMQSGDNLLYKQCEFNNAENISFDFFSNNAQDVRSFYKPKPDLVQDTSDAIYHSPIATEVSSLMTEDLSDDPPQPQVRPNKWYLFSEDETTNTNMANVQDPSTNVASFGANLNQIFPITCAVPDLSTITEMSRENDNNSRKPTREGNSGDGFISQKYF